jgi:hypothetical protein
MIFYEDFNSSDGVFTASNVGYPQGPWTWDGSGTWFTNGSDTLGVPSSSILTAPDLLVTANGSVELSFDHRYSIEDGNTFWDAAAVFLSLNGGVYTQVLGGAFSQNGYNATSSIGNHILNGLDGFNGESAGYASGEFITSIANLGSFQYGDVMSIQFVMGWDEFAKGAEPNWQLDLITVSDASSVPEPGTLALLAIGLAALGLSRRKRKV